MNNSTDLQTRRYAPFWANRRFPGEVLSGLPIRWRLSLWYGAVLAVILAAFGAAVYGMMRHYAQLRTDRALFDELSEVQDEIEHAVERNHLHERLERRFGDDANNEYQIVDPAGSVVFRSRLLGAQELPLPPNLDGSADPLETIRLHGDQRWRVATRRMHGPEGDLIAQVAVSLEADQASLRNLLRIMLIAGPIAIAGALAGGYFLARQALAPVDRMVATASEITASRLDRRLSVGPNRDELARLASAFNSMIERLDHSFHEMRRFTGDAAHELRTPLAIIRSAADVGLGEPNVAQECRHAFEDILEEVERLGQLADQLLFLTREDAGMVIAAFAPVRLDVLAGDVVDHLRLVANEKGVAIEAASLEPIAVDGDTDRLRRLLLNLVDNAIKFTPPGGQVAVTVTQSEDGAHIQVRDTGIGIAAEYLPLVFDRFYRVDPARDHENGGAGLGLAICKAIVQAHGGEIRVDSSPEQGTCIYVCLPRATANSRPRQAT